MTNDGSGASDASPTADRPGASGRTLLVLAAVGILSITASTSVIYLGYPWIGLLLVAVGLGSLGLAVWLLVR